MFTRNFLAAVLSLLGVILGAGAAATFGDARIMPRPSVLTACAPVAQAAPGQFKSELYFYPCVTATENKIGTDFPLALHLQNKGKKTIMVLSTLRVELIPDSCGSKGQKCKGQTFSSVQLSLAAPVKVAPGESTVADFVGNTQTTEKHYKGWIRIMLKGDGSSADGDNGLATDYSAMVALK